jgi:cysteine-rich repeat protein
MHSSGVLSTLLLLGSFAGCLRPDSRQCGDLTCPADTTCVPGGCATAEEIAACAGLADRTTCTTSDISTGGLCTDGVCREYFCGDGDVGAAEVCDDGNQVDGDGCSARCNSDESCGNQVIDLSRGEQCDDGVRGLSSDGCSSTCGVEFAEWENITPTILSPRDSMAMAFDAERQRVVLIGGDFQLASVSGTLGKPPDFFEFDGQIWRNIAPAVAGEAPPFLRRTAMAYDAFRKQLVVFGGYAGVNTGASNNSTWLFDGARWSKVPAQANPPVSRFAHALAYDSDRQRVVLFGGNNRSGTDTNDMWTFDGQVWTEVTQVGSRPPARNSHAMAYDPLRQRVVVAGGNSISNPSPGTMWEFDPAAATWTNRSADIGLPAGGNVNGIVFDTARQRLVLVTSGGETWERIADSWQRVTGAQPPARGLSALAFDSKRGKSVLFGGSVGDSIGDTWEYDGIWREVKAFEKVNSVNLTSVAAAYDRTSARVIVTAINAMAGCSSATLAFDGLVWQRLTTLGMAPELQSATMVFDSIRNRMLLFGGFDCRGNFSNKTWALAGNSWSQLAPTTNPPARAAASMTYDPVRDRVILFGGSDGGVRGLNDTWEFDGNDWSKIPIAEPPPARQGASLAYDERSGDHLLYNGDVYRYRNGTWALVEIVGDSPPPRRGASWTCDLIHGDCLLFGGADDASEGNDTWRLRGDKWQNLSSQLQSEPPPSLAASAVYDPARGRVLVIGGQALQTWSFGYTSPAKPRELCSSSMLDVDEDGLAGCLDPDCWALCSPSCPPVAVASGSCNQMAPRCGDGACAPSESLLLCPQDCRE